MEQAVQRKTIMMIGLAQLMHWGFPWSQYKKVLFDFLVTDFVLLL